MPEQEDFHRPEKPREIIDNKATILEKTEMKRKFSRNQKRITPWDIDLVREQKEISDMCFIYFIQKIKNLFNCVSLFRAKDF